MIDWCLGDWCLGDWCLGDWCLGDWYLGDWCLGDWCLCLEHLLSVIIKIAKHLQTDVLAFFGMKLGGMNSAY